MSLLLPVELLAAVAVLVVVLTVRHFIRTHGLRKVAFNLLRGHHLDGEHRSNRGVFRTGTAHASGAGTHTSWLARRPMAQRAAAAWIAILAAVYGTIGWLADPGLVTVLAICGLGGAGGLGMVLALRWLRRRPHRVHLVRPVASAIAWRLEQSPGVVARNLTIRPRQDKLAPGDEAVRLRGLPDGLTQNDQEFVEQILNSRLPHDLNYRWETAKHPMEMLAVCQTSPPRAVVLADHLETIAKLDYGQYFLGRSADGDEIWDSTEDEPHLKCGGRSRGGKTNFNSAIIGQGLGRGEAFSACDPKRVSLSHFVGVPGFRLANDPGNIPQMWQLIHEFKREMDRAIAGEPVRDSQGRPRPHKLVLEEINQLFELFRAHWEDIKDTKDRITAVPAWQDVKAVLHQGPQFGYSVIVDGQDLKDEVLFRARSQFGVTVMTRYTKRQWDYATGVTPMPPVPTRKGRFYLVRGDQPVAMQTVCADPRPGHGTSNDRLWREFALAGRAEEQAAPAGNWRWYQRLPLALPPAPVRRRPEPRLPKAIPAVFIGNSEAARYLGISRKAFIERRRRNPVPGEFSTDIRGNDQPAWTREAIDRWGMVTVNGHSNGHSTADRARS
jgi:hypothetical protein